MELGSSNQAKRALEAEQAKLKVS